MEKIDIWPFLIVIVGVIASVFVILLNRPPSVVGDAKVLEEIDRLGSLHYTKYVYDNLTEDDLTPLQMMVAKDSQAHSLVDEAMWLRDNGEYEHVGHSLYYLQEYVKSGENDICIPHELQHIKIYLKHEDYDLVEKQVVVAAKYESRWFDLGAKRFSQLPQFNVKFKEIKPKIEEVIERLRDKQYDQHTMELLGYIEQNEIC